MLHERWRLAGMHGRDVACWWGEPGNTPTLKLVYDD